MSDDGILTTFISFSAILVTCVLCCKWCMIRRDHELHSISFESGVQPSAPPLEYEPLPTIQDDEPSISV